MAFSTLSFLEALKRRSEKHRMESHVILSPVLEVLTGLEFYEKQQDRRGRRKSNEHLNLAVNELQRMMNGQLISGKDVIGILLFVWANCDGYEQNFFPSKIEYDDDVNVFLKRFRVSTEAFIHVISRCDLLHDLRWVLKDMNDTYLNERLTSAVLLLSQNEASVQIVDVTEKQNTEGEDRDYQTSFLQTNTILRLERHKSVEEKNNVGDGLNTSSHFHGAVEKEMVKVMNRINCEKEISVKEALKFSRSLLPLKLSSPAKFTQLLLHYAAENSSNMPLILSAAYNSPGLIELEFFIRAFRDLVGMKPHLLTALNVFTASLFNANMARMHTDGNGNYDTSLFDPREGILYVVLPLLHSSHESSVVEFAIHLLRDITIDGTQFDYTLVFRTYPGSILLSLASVVNARSADDGYSERVRELASSTLSVYVDRFEQLVKEERIHLTKHGLESIERLRSVATRHLDWDTRLRIEPVLQYGIRKRDVVNEKPPPSLNCKFDSVTLRIKNVLVDIFCISRSGDEVLLRVVRVLFPFEEEVTEGEEEIVSNIDVSLVEFRSIIEEVAGKYRDHLNVALLWASSEVFPRCTFSEVQRIVFGLFPKLLSQFAVMSYNRNARTCKDEMETDGITLDLFVKVIKTTRNTTDIGILTRQLANIVSSSPRDSFAFQLLGFRSLCSALSVVSVSSRGRSKSRAEGALSAAAFDILAKVVRSSKSQECKKKILEEMLAVLPTADLPDIAKQIKLEISKI